MSAPPHMHIDDASFEPLILRADGAVVLAFGSSWSRPASRVRQYFEGVMADFDDVRSAWLDVDKMPRTAGHYGIKSLPTVLLFFQGKVSERRAGVLTAEEARQLFEKARAMNSEG